MESCSSELLVNEIFVSLQGEGDWSGWPCFFVRLTGCNLRCLYCDTVYAYDSGKKLSIDGIIEAWRSSRVPLVQVTGGEPLIQQGTMHLASRLIEQGAVVLLETNGSLPIDGLPKRVIKVLDRKTPGSGMERLWCRENIRLLGRGDQLKFVITNRKDYEWSKKELNNLDVPDNVQVLFSAAADLLSPRALAGWIIEDRLPVRFQMQLHKVLWGDQRGV
ncbi:MAG TPA: radical SAM protein [Thermodesulfobacteriaceae bacterium]|nr:radical SAM protein [Thermodesulfobacteriaceae bacterium]